MSIANLQLVREAAFSYTIKTASLLLAILFVSRIASGETFYLELTYIVGLVNMAKILDGSLPYLQRINFPRGYMVNTLDEIQFSLVLMFIQIGIFTILTGDIFLSASLAIFGKIYAVGKFRFNVGRKSYLLYLQNTIALAVCLLLPNATVYDPAVLYLLVSIIVLGFCFFVAKGAIAGNVVNTSLSALWDKNVTSNLVTMSIFFFYAEFAAVFLYGSVSDEDYAVINTATRACLLIVGGASILSTTMWNTGNQTVSKLDRLMVERFIYLPIISLGVVVYFWLSTQPTVIIYDNTFDLAMVCALVVISIASAGNLFIADLLARMELSFNLMFLGFFELISLLLILLFYQDVEKYFLFWMMLVVTKYILGNTLVRRKVV